MFLITEKRVGASAWPSPSASACPTFDTPLPVHFEIEETKP